MQTIEINDQIAEQIKQLANKEHISASQVIERLLMRYAQEKETATFQGFFGALKDSPNFKGDPVEIQWCMRDE